MAELILTHCDECDALLYVRSARSCKEADEHRQGLTGSRVECRWCSHKTQMHDKLGCPVTFHTLEHALHARRARYDWEVFSPFSVEPVGICALCG